MWSRRNFFISHSGCQRKIFLFRPGLEHIDQYISFSMILFGLQFYDTLALFRGQNYDYINGIDKIKNEPNDLSIIRWKKMIKLQPTSIAIRVQFTWG